MAILRAMKWIFSIAVLIPVLSAQASPCHPHFWANNSLVFNKHKTLLVTHASSFWDTNRVSKNGINQTIHWGHKNGFEVAYLQDQNSSPDESYYYEDCNPDYYIKSSDGEFSARIPSRTIVSIGGYWEACHANSVEKIFEELAASPNKNRNLIFVTDAIYLSRLPFFVDDNGFRSIPSGPSVLLDRTLTLQRALQAFTYAPDRFLLLQTRLTQYVNFELLKDYQISLSLNLGKDHIIQSGSRPASPKLKIKFLSSDLLAKAIQ